MNAMECISQAHNMYQYDTPPDDTIAIHDQMSFDYDLSQVKCSGLSLQRNSIERLDAHFYPRIKYLNLTENFIHGHGLITDPFTNLEVLILDRNILSYVPERFSEVFPALQSLSLSQNKILKTEFIRNITNLKKLNLNENYIKILTSLPPNLEHLTVKRNDLQLVQSRLPSTLISVDLRKNNLNYGGLPLNWGSSLRTLNLSFNKIQRFPRKLPETLQYLDLEGNCLEELPKELPMSLKYFNVGYNKIRTFRQYPENKLDIFILSNNQLAELPNQSQPWVNVLVTDNNWDKIQHAWAQKRIRNAWKRTVMKLRLRTLYRCRILYYELMTVSMQPGRFYQVL